jgi:hypothetical protein
MSGVRRMVPIEMLAEPIAECDPCTMRSMRALLIAALLLGLASAQARKDLVPGVVESVQQIEPDSTAEPYPKMDPDELDPPLRTQLVVRLDDGRTLITTYGGKREFEVGERVRVHLDAHSAFVL